MGCAGRTGPQGERPSRLAAPVKPGRGSPMQSPESSRWRSAPMKAPTWARICGRQSRGRPGSTWPPRVDTKCGDPAARCATRRASSTSRERRGADHAAEGVPDLQRTKVDTRGRERRVVPSSGTRIDCPPLVPTGLRTPVGTRGHGHSCGRLDAASAVTCWHRPSSRRTWIELKIRVSAVQLRPRPPIYGRSPPPTFLRLSSSSPRALRATQERDPRGPRRALRARGPAAPCPSCRTSSWEMRGVPLRTPSPVSGRRRTSSAGRSPSRPAGRAAWRCRRRRRAGSSASHRADRTCASRPGPSPR